MLGIYMFINAVCGLLFARLATNMNLVGTYILMTAAGLVLFIFGVYVFGVASTQAAIGSIAFTLVFLVSLLARKKKAKEKQRENEI